MKYTVAVRGSEGPGWYSLIEVDAFKFDIDRGVLIFIDQHGRWIRAFKNWEEVKQDG